MADIPSGFEVVSTPQSDLPEGFEVVSPPEQTNPLASKIDAYHAGQLDERGKSVLEELSRRGKVDLTPPDKWGPLDYIMSVIEPTATIGSAMIAEPLAGLTGVVGSLIPGEEGQAAKGIENVREAFTYLPKTEAGMKGLERVGKVIEPVGSLIEKAQTAVGDVGYKVGGPVGGATAVTVLNAIPELLGLKGTRAAKRALTARVFKSVKPEEVFDEIGNLLPEVENALTKAGMTAQDVSDIKNAVNVGERVQQTAENVGKAATSMRKGLASERLAAEVRPSQEILSAADEFGLRDRLIPSHYSQNPVYVQVEQGLKSIPGSQLSVREKQVIEDIAKRADSLIEEFGGTLDKAELSDNFRTASQDVITGLEKQAEKVYGDIGRAIPRDTPVDTSNIIDAIMRHADELGGEQYLKPVERRLLRDLSPDTKPTYARLDELRRDIGNGYKGRGKFKDSTDADLGRIYGALAEDQKAAAKGAGVGDLYETATDLVISRKGMEKQLTAALGKDFYGNITTKAGDAVKALQKGDTSRFDKLLDVIPVSLGADTKRKIVATALNDAFTQGSRAEKSLSIPAFDDFINGIKKNKVAKQRLVDVLGEDAVNRMETLHKVVGGIRKAQKESISTGRIMSVPGILDEQKGLASRIFGTLGKIAAAEGATSAMGIPGAGTTGVLARTIGASRTPRSVAADNLLASPKFQQILERQAANRSAGKKTISDVLNNIERLKEYQKWKTTLPERDIMDLQAVGAIGYFLGDPLPSETQQEGAEQ